MRYAPPWREPSNRRRRARHACVTARSERDISPAFELEDATRVVRRRHFETESLDDRARAPDLSRVRFRQPAGPEPEAVLETDTHVAAHGRGHCGNGQLIASRAE